MVEFPIRSRRCRVTILAVAWLLASCQWWDPAPAPEPVPTPSELPTHGAQFLSLRNGGSVPERYYEAIGAIVNGRRDTLGLFELRNFAAPSRPGTPDTRVNAIYFNAGDLNLGRDMRCRDTAGRVACAVSNHVRLEGGKPVFTADPSFALNSLVTGGTPFATVAMEWESPLTDEARIVTVLECAGLITPPIDGRSCGDEDRPPIFGGEIRGPAPNQDVDTGIDVNPGDTVIISATGTVDTGFVFAHRTGPAGDDGITTDPAFPMQHVRPFGLIGRIGASAAYDVIGEGRRIFYRGATARLFLRTNDNLPGNGWGHFDVKVEVKRAAVVKFFVYGSEGQLLDDAALDSEGAKRVPGVCLACHGGIYDPATHVVKGASFLPFNVNTFKFSTVSPYTRAEQEEAFRKLNQLVYRTRPPEHGEPVQDFIDGLYGLNGVFTANTPARNDLVPAAWDGPDRDLYTKIVRPYCATCHIAMGNDKYLNFSSAFEFKHRLSGDRLRNNVCLNRSMPHAEVTFSNFWTDNMGQQPQAFADALGLLPCSR